MANYNFPEKPEWSEEIRKLESTDKGHADVFNEVFQGIVNHIAYLKEEQKHIDGGSFTGDPVEIHAATAFAHSNMVVEGGSVELADGSIVTNLAEHLADEYAHQNIILDGNINE